MQFHRWLRSVASLMVLGLLTGCSGTKESSRPRIALVMKSLANEFFLTMENGARAHQRAHSDQYELLANGIKDELDVARQIDLVEQMIAQRVDAIVIAPGRFQSPGGRVQEGYGRRNWRRQHR